MDLRPVVMQRAAARVRMADQFEAEPILDFALLPIHRRNCSRQRRKFWIIRRDRHAQDAKSMCRVHRVNIIKMKHAFILPRIIREHADQPGLPTFVQMPAEARHKFGLRFKVNFVELRDAQELQSISKSLRNLVQDWLQYWQ